MTLSDPGVGSFGDFYGYPADGRGNYTEMTYTSLRNAWENRYFISILVKPLPDQTPTVEEELGPAVRDRLLGEPSAYFADATTALVWHFGQKAFRELSEAVTADGLIDYLSVFGDTPREFKASLTLFIGLAVEAQVTLQYLSFRTAVERLPHLIPSHDLGNLETSAQAALPHMGALSDNATLTYPGNLSRCHGFVASVFKTLADAINGTDDVEQTIREHSANLTVISNHLLAIADAWQAAGQALAEIWPNDPIVIYGPVLAAASFGVGALVVVVLLWSRHRPSQ